MLITLENWSDGDDMVLDIHKDATEFNFCGYDLRIELIKCEDEELIDILGEMADHYKVSIDDEVDEDIRIYKEGNKYTCIQFLGHEENYSRRGESPMIAFVQLLSNIL